ncbi:MAG: SUMF1/EgtB/PvdO family nonheme iron enzyme, partial [Anaerolineae bacterium]
MDDLIRQLEAALAALKAGEPDAQHRLAAGFRSLTITTEDIQAGEGSAIAVGEGNRVSTTINNYGYTVAEVIAIVRAFTEREGTASGRRKRTEAGKHIFMSYARVDGITLASWLIEQLQARGYTIWQVLRSMDTEADFTGEIEKAIRQATHLVMLGTPDVCRESSFVRLEVTFAKEHGVPIIPLLVGDGCRPINIYNHTYLRFDDREAALPDLLARVANPAGGEPTVPLTLRERETTYLAEVAQTEQFARWKDLYAGMAGEAHLVEEKRRVSQALRRHFELQAELFQDIDHRLVSDDARTIKTEGFDELREAIWTYRRVALLGDPGAGKTTTLERLAYEMAEAAIEDPDAPLPLFVRLAAYKGEGLDAFLQKHFGGLPLKAYLDAHTAEDREVFLLFDGLNEIPQAYQAEVDAWLRKHREVPVIVTCRTLYYVGLKLPLQRVDVLPLAIDRVYQFIQTVYEDGAQGDELFWALAGPRTRAAWEWHRERGDAPTFGDFWFAEPGGEPNAWRLEEHRRWQLRRAVRKHRPGDLPRELVGMLGVVSNPFLLNTTIYIDQSRGEPPQNRGELFELFVSTLLRREIHGQKLSAERAGQLRQAMAALAYQMQAERKPTLVDAAWARRTVEAALPGENGERLLRDAAGASIIEMADQVRYTHQLLQEYFAAFQMGEDLRAGVSAAEYWPDDERWWQQTGWEETAVLLAGITRNGEGELDATPVVEWLTPVQPRLAYRWATESGAPCAGDALQVLYEADPPQRVAPLAKVRWGNILAERGDDRPGVGVVNGVPDIAWVDIPAGSVEIKGQPFPVEPFQMAKYPVTHAQYQAFVEAGDGYCNPAWWDYSEEATTWRKENPQHREAQWPVANRPRERVSWYEAVAFCRWLGEKRGEAIRLPTEWEWQWAAQGSTDWAYPWGPEYLPGYANIDEVGSGVGPYYLRETSAVGMYPHGASPFEVLDMSGNVWEWCLNEYGKVDKISLKGDEHRVVRGGSFYSLLRDARASNRLRNFPYYRNLNDGFRVVA